MNEITTAKVSLSILPSKDSRPPMKQLLKKTLQKYLLKKGMQITSVGEGYFSIREMLHHFEATLHLQDSITVN
ncbi:hypothetical protein SAMN06297358_3115 [Pedobacter xixiisoli]|uniref:Uncharacterized protein n=1 Tax=Pedobacter xixiisoli TaxID=1476464 RepID=A0A286A9R2_9SPHI|nr:hypothetical protein SAMN06297358_3115 [Pedobacter xixiisoli]